VPATDDLREPGNDAYDRYGDDRPEPRAAANPDIIASLPDILREVNRL